MVEDLCPPPPEAPIIRTSCCLCSLPDGVQLAAYSVPQMPAELLLCVGFVFSFWFSGASPCSPLLAAVSLRQYLRGIDVEEEWFICLVVPRL